MEGEDNFYDSASDQSDFDPNDPDELEAGDEDEEEQEIDEELDGDEVIEQAAKKGGKVEERIVRDGDSRETIPVMNRFEFCNAVKHVANQINNGAKVPKIIRGTRFMKCTDAKLLAWYSVFFSVRHSMDEPVKSPEKRLECASVIIHRKVGSKFSEPWRLWELVYLDTFPKNFDLNLEYVKKYLADGSEVGSSGVNVTY